MERRRKPEQPGKSVGIREPGEYFVRLIEVLHASSDISDIIKVLGSIGGQIWLCLSICAELINLKKWRINIFY